MKKQRRSGAGQVRRRVSTPSGTDLRSAGRGPSRLQIPLRISRVRPEDISAIVALDQRITGLAKPTYWEDIYERYGRRGAKDRFFLVAEPQDPSAGSRVLGFIVGEVRAWEFGSAPCGWIFALSVEPGARLRGVGEMLFNAIAEEFKAAGVNKLRTMVERDHLLPLSFFRGEGMIAGPYIQLEKELP